MEARVRVGVRLGFTLLWYLVLESASREVYGTPKGVLACCYWHFIYDATHPSPSRCHICAADAPR